MFWHHDDFVEEEWSISAKVFAGLVFNPFSVVNKREDSLFLWFLHRATGDLSLKPRCWSATTEYRGLAGRNDWRLHADKWRIAVECKFGDGIDPFKDCLQYLEDSSTHHRVALVASVSELAELTDICRTTNDKALELKRSIEVGNSRLLAWPDIIDAAIDRFDSEEDAAILKAWADGAVKDDLKLMPDTRISGKEFEELINQERSAGIPYTHDPSWQEGKDKPWDIVYSVNNPPDWVRRCLEAAWLEFSDRRELKLKRVLSGWADIKRKSLNYSVTLFPWQGGVAIIISHPRKSKEYPGFSRLVELTVDGAVPTNKRHFPRDRALGVEFLDPIAEQEFVSRVSEAVSLL